jgi:hypothetical protein
LFEHCVAPALQVVPPSPPSPVLPSVVPSELDESSLASPASLTVESGAVESLPPSSDESTVASWPEPLDPLELPDPPEPPDELP